MKTLLALTALAGIFGAANAADKACLALKKMIGGPIIEKLMDMAEGDEEFAATPFMQLVAAEKPMDQQMTFFKPSGPLADPVLKELLHDFGNDPMLKKVLMNHMLPSFLENLNPMETPMATYYAEGAGITIEGGMMGADVYISPEDTSTKASLMRTPSILTCAGLLHTVDQVLVPADIGIECEAQVWANKVMPTPHNYKKFCHSTVSGSDDEL